MDKTILIVEDELYIREMYEYVLKKEYNVITAVDGQDGIDKSLKKPDLILLDIMLPKKNGVQVLKELKANEETKHIPVVIITNLAEKKIIEETYELGAQGYMLKVRFNPNDISTVIKQYIDDPTYVMKLHPNL